MNANSGTRSARTSRGREVSVLTLDGAGAIVDCEGSVERMFGYAPEALVDRDVATVIPRLKEIGIAKGGKVNGMLRYLCQLGAPFPVRHREAGTYDSRLLVVDLRNTPEFRVRVFVSRDA